MFIVFYGHASHPLPFYNITTHPNLNWINYTASIWETLPDDRLTDWHCSIVCVYTNPSCVKHTIGYHFCGLSPCIWWCSILPCRSYQWTVLLTTPVNVFIPHHHLIILLLSLASSGVLPHDHHLSLRISLAFYLYTATIYLSPDRAHLFPVSPGHLSKWL